jgi:pimeloyl-ACP methyl ester carboxylesterase
MKGKFMSKYVLIHGSFLGGWCWNKVKKELEENGHIVFAPDLPGHSISIDISAKEISLEKYVSFVCDLIRKVDDKVILVGHSLGGAIITNAAEYVHERIEKLVYVCAVVPKNGDKVSDLLKSDASPEIESVSSINKIKMHIELDYDKIEKAIFNGCKEEDIDIANRHLVPQPLKPFLEPIILEKENYRKLDRLGIVCSEDKSLRPVFQEKMYKEAGCIIKVIESGHAPFFSKAEELSKILLGCTKGKVQ